MPPPNDYVVPNDAPPAPIHRVLKGQKAVVTGAVKGLGQAIAIGFGQAGADVLVNYYSDEAGARETAKAIEDAGARAVVFKADTGKEDEVKAMFERMTEAFGRLD